MELDVQDVAALLSEVEAFSLQRVIAATERPENILPDQELVALSNEAADMGLIPVAHGEPGFALWENCDQQGSMAFNIGLLKNLGYANAGIAFAWHRASLARIVAAALRAEMPAEGVLGATILTNGCYGLAQSALGRLLSQRLAGEDGAMLADWLDRCRHSSVLVAPEAWESLVWPVWHEGWIGWQVLAREQVAVEVCRSLHGFDELKGFQVSLKSGVAVPEVIVPPSPDSLYERVLKLDMLGLLAIGAGSVRRAAKYAAEYTAIRKQGGKTISGHPAVQQMLGEIEMAAYQADSMLQQLSRPIDEIPLSEVAALRAAAHVSLCHGANQALQAHGGIGYMRDAGPEKIVRDQNMLRLQAGGLREIPLLLAGLNGGRA